MTFPLLQLGQTSQDLLEHEIVWLAVPSRTLPPFSQSQFPDVARTLRIVAVFIEHAAQLEENGSWANESDSCCTTDTSFTCSRKDQHELAAI